MPESLLTVLRLLLLGLIWLFFLRVLVLLISGPKTAAAPAQAPAPTAARAPATPAAAPAGGGRPTVRVTSGGALKGKEFIVGTEATIGRGAGCQVMIPEPQVSQLHARLFREGNTLQVEDLGSMNGTYLNGRKIGPPAKLKRGDRVRVGPVELEVLG